MQRFLGIDLGGTNIKYSIIEFNGNRVAEILKDQIATEAKSGPKNVVGRIAGLITKLDSQFELTSIGVTVPGFFEHDSGDIRLFPNLPGAWENYPFRSEIVEQAGKEISLINDARAFCLAEATLGAGRGYRYIACIVMGTGVGGGIVIDGKVHQGASRAAGHRSGAARTWIGEAPGGRVAGNSRPSLRRNVRKPFLRGSVAEIGRAHV